jgi:hypothetical protein
MPNYIVIDRRSGHIFVDSRDLSHEILIDGKRAADHELTPLFVCRWGDASIKKKHGRAYSEVNHHDATGTYDVYTPDAELGDELPYVNDGRCLATIEMVLRHYRRAATIAARDVE